MNRRDFLKSIAAAGMAGGSASLSPAANAKGGIPDPANLGVSGEHLVYTWKGSPFEIGVQHGKALRDPIIKEAKAAIEALTKARGTSTAKALDYIVATHEPVFRDHAPMAIEEIRGIGQGSGLGYSFAFFAATRDGIRLPAAETANCTAIACGKPTTVGGKVLIGQNKDTGSDLDRYRINRVAYDSGRKMIVLNYPGWIANLVLTSDGVSTTGNSLYARSTEADVIPFSLLKRLAMEKRSVNEVLAAVPKYPFDNGCMMLGDATGHLVCMERVNGRTNIRDVSQEAFGHANNILCEECKPFEEPERINASSPVRQKTVQARLDALRGRIRPDDLKEIFGDHAEYPLSICRHRSTPGQESTTASFVANLTDMEMEIAIGNPCVAPYRRYTFDF